jgi:hypothetical protein
MNEWQERFVQKLETARSAACDRFEQMADETLAPTFEEFSAFTREHYIRATAPLTKPGIRTYKFAITENAYLLMTFRHVGFEQCDAQAEFFVPGRTALPSTSETVGLSEFDAQSCRRAFQQALDHFLEATIDSMGKPKEAVTEAVPA